MQSLSVLTDRKSGSTQSGDLFLRCSVPSPLFLLNLVELHFVSPFLFFSVSCVLALHVLTNESRCREIARHERKQSERTEKPELPVHCVLCVGRLLSGLPRDTRHKRLVPPASASAGVDWRHFFLPLNPFSFFALSLIPSMAIPGAFCVWRKKGYNQRMEVKRLNCMSGRTWT
jgi:hypothetical protein